MTVYVPDDLLQRAQRLHKEAENNSQLVQQALQRLVDDHAVVPTYAMQPTDALPRLQNLQKKLAAEARDEYKIGYDAALDVAEDISLSELNRLADLNFDLRVWLHQYRMAAADELYDHGEPTSASADSSDESWYRLLREREGGKPP